MEKLIVEKALRSKLHNLDTDLELCDESGQTLGYYLPAAQGQRLLYAWAHKEFKEEEIERARQEPGGLPIAEVLEGLGET